jgi:hypothetical protein
MIKNIIKENIVSSSIFLFLALFGILVYIKPQFLYNTDGSLRVFGIGYKNKTILPLFIISIILGILSYFFIIVYISKYWDISFL